MSYLRVKNFETFQHYKNKHGKPHWIKLYTGLLEDDEFHELPTTAQRHLIMIWLLASRTGNKLRYDPGWIARRIEAKEDITKDIKILIETGFLVKV